MIFFRESVEGLIKTHHAPDFIIKTGKASLFGRIGRGLAEFAGG